MTTILLHSLSLFVNSRQRTVLDTIQHNTILTICQQWFLIVFNGGHAVQIQVLAMISEMANYDERF